ncbi:molybdenum cofactor sulfurylase [Aliiruegeria haliotis]|uniref:Molybdenum cofactor sulfurylase n=1 Tax=Aliiruegeria haliotis TaxID=1280846 RepID=A0A2T0RRS7_9RHOB|nr:xanthine dehydrogenase accessory protein XdhC [Aliiruegeria haliotis]PRY23810.1 molybdenum cofactor sulfurylase [Aliiruegeria haliotis]
MSFDPGRIRATLARERRVARVVVAEVSGSAPREAGAAMLVWPDGQSGTIGGGALELDAASAARLALATGGTTVRRVPLGPALGQCCGGAVTLVTEVFDASKLDALESSARQGHVLRPVDPDAPALPLRRHLRALRNGSEEPRTLLAGGWFLEPVARARHALWLHGAGHVGRAIVATMAPLPDWKITWVDTAPDRFPEIPDGVDILVAADPAQAVAHAPADAHHLVLTYSHALDLALCHAVLERGFASAGLIGSATKWARFRNRLGQLGHADAAISRIRCPIGDPRLGKHPQAIAIGVTKALLEATASSDRTAMERPA